MDSDFNTADALGALFSLVSKVNAALDQTAVVPAGEREGVRDALASIDGVLGLLEVARSARAVDSDVTEWVEERIQARSDARRRKDFGAADAIRAELAAKGIVLEDGPSGTRWKVVS
jgi:cysteinyl-tRNA synthetase